MAVVFVSIGSNVDRNIYVANAIDALHNYFGKVVLSSVFESEAVGFDGDNFYNLVARFDTELPLAELSSILKGIEDENGRCRKGPKFSGRTLDIDILTYDQLSGVIEGIELPRGEIETNAFVLKPLAEIAPVDSHPVTGQSYSAMWQAYDKTKQKLWEVEFVWNGHSLPCVVSG